MNGGHIGRSLRRLEDPRFLTGQGRYVDDMDLPGQLHGIVLRSPHGHAAIEGIETIAARAMPGGERRVSTRIGRKDLSKSCRAAGRRNDATVIVPQL